MKVENEQSLAKEVKTILKQKFVCGQVHEFKSDLNKILRSYPIIVFNDGKTIFSVGFLFSGLILSKVSFVVEATGVKFHFKVLLLDTERRGEIVLVKYNLYLFEKNSLASPERKEKILKELNLVLESWEPII